MKEILELLEHNARLSTGEIASMLQMVHTYVVSGELKLVAIGDGLTRPNMHTSMLIQ